MPLLFLQDSIFTIFNFLPLSNSSIVQLSFVEKKTSTLAVVHYLPTKIAKRLKLFLFPLLMNFLIWVFHEETAFDAIFKLSLM